VKLNGDVEVFAEMRKRFEESFVRSQQQQPLGS